MKVPVSHLHIGTIWALYNITKRNYSQNKATLYAASSSQQVLPHRYAERVYFYNAVKNPLYSRFHRKLQRKKRHVCVQRM